MKKSALTLMLYVFTYSFVIKADTTDDYLIYHQQIVQAEELISTKSFAQALQMYQQVFETFEFVFIRDYKVAIQLAWHLGEEEKTFSLLRRGIASGWTMKSIKKNHFLNGIRKIEQWNLIKDQHDSLFARYSQRINSELRLEIKEMFRKDQWKALGALLRLSSKAQDRYAERKFAPQNELQLKRLVEIIATDGYPGERLIGDDIWTQTIFGHHNSISQNYCKKDTIYQNLKPSLIEAIKKGEMAPFEFALIEDWFITVESGWQTASYGYLVGLKEKDLSKANQKRNAIGLMKVETRNRLIEIQEETGMNFYLPQWPKKNGKINISKD